MTQRQRWLAWFTLTILVLGVFYLMIQNVKQTTTARDAQQAQALDKANHKVSVLGDQLRALGETPKVPTSPVQQPQIIVGRDGPAGAAGAAGRDGKDGMTGRTGPGGPAGPAGPAGANGKDGAPGPAGPAGTDGKDGKDGRSVTGVSCSAVGPGVTFRFTYSDGSTDEVNCS